MYYPYVEPQNRQGFSREMTVSGEGKIAAVPDTASIQLGVVTEREQLSDAQQQNASDMNQVIQALQGAGIPEEDIQTAVYTIQPMYDYVEGQQVFRAYQVVNLVTVTIADIVQTGNLIDTAVASGANRVSSIQLTLADENQYYQQALSLAIADAGAKAETMADSLNVSLDPIPVKITEGSPRTPRTAATFAAVETAASTPIEPGQLIIHAKIEAKFRY